MTSLKSWASYDPKSLPMATRIKQKSSRDGQATCASFLSLENEFWSVVRKLLKARSTNVLYTMFGTQPKANMNTTISEHISLGMSGSIGKCIGTVLEI